MEMPMINECHAPSLKDRLKFSICCFATSYNNPSETLDSDDGRRLHTPRSTYAWLKSTAQDLEIRDKCWGLIGTRGKNRRRYNSSDFRYDPTSYSLNFEDENNREDELPLSNFTARLPPSPVGRRR
ncbi:hypothetical protein JCGZ_07120 [Jatropha curcas]|uniref:Uncharacterized protein n=1 Tax=Jatropha curcas TaxID=180498 RepID=A0A067KP11_JATCU|nr:uncharacterized protein LOC105637589 [Jatropha curcas]KDP33549.1 hypothetical protein JCGZ_07120 [Jatropha curcas]